VAEHTFPERGVLHLGFDCGHVDAEFGECGLADFVVVGFEGVASFDDQAQEHGERWQ
jgi:hypothetical protein